MRTQQSFVVEQKLKTLVLITVATKFKPIEIPLLSSNSLQNFRQIEQKTAEISHFDIFVTLPDCVCDSIFT